jgi:curved DNA-binding protein CbpA
LAYWQSCFADRVMRGTRVRNPYKVLGIASTADDQRIKSAFRRRALTTHPDLNPGNDRAEERFRELMEAYQVLRDTRARTAYDAHIARQRSRARRRFMQSAAVMVATFVLTTSSAVLVAGLQGISVHSETWQIATAWLTSIEVEPSASGQQPVTEAASKGTLFATTVVAATRAEGSSVRNGKTELESSAKARKRVAAAAQRSVPADDGARTRDGWWPWSAAGEPPRYGLGASDVK